MAGVSKLQQMQAAALVQQAASEPRKKIHPAAQPEQSQAGTVTLDPQSLETSPAETAPEPKPEPKAAPVSAESLPDIPESSIDKKATRKRQITTTKDHVSLKNFPKTLMEAVRQQVPNVELTNPEAVSVVVALQTGVLEGLSPKVLEEVKRQKAKEKTLDTVLSTQRVLSRKLDDLHALLDQVDLSTAYLIFDRLNFRKADAPTPAKVDMAEAGMDELQRNIRKTSRERAARAKQKKGART